MSGRAFTDAEVRAIVERYPHEATKPIAADLGRSLSSVYQKADKLGLSKSAAYMRRQKAEDGARLVRTGKASRWVAGHETWNKGKPHAPPGSCPTQFRPGRRPEHHRPVGSERINTEGVRERKVAEPSLWRSVHVLLWESHHGPLPKNHVVSFLNGDRSDIRIDNLRCVSRAEVMRQNTIHRFPRELVCAIRQIGAMDKRLDQYEDNQR